MTKQDVMRQVSKKTGLDPLIVRLVTEAFLEVVKESLTEGEPVYIRRFGSFILKRRAPKVGRNISQQTSIQIGAQVLPWFKPSDDFAAQVKVQEVPTKSKKATS